MSKVDIGRRPTLRAVTRAGLFSAALLGIVALAGCTTVEGTNALTDMGTFEREVMTSTLVGLSIVPKTVKDEPTTPRAPLVIPKTAAGLPAPTTAGASAALPVNSDRAQIDTQNLSESDIRRLRNARVVDMRSLGGRPLTEAEAKALTARATVDTRVSNKRPLYLPPDEYFTTVGGQDLVCLSAKGDLVPLNDKACPSEVRKAAGRR